MKCVPIMTANENSGPVPAGAEPDRRLEGEDKRLVDLVTAVLVDPNVHTDVRMRLHREIAEALRSSARPSSSVNSTTSN